VKAAESHIEARKAPHIPISYRISEGKEEGETFEFNDIGAEIWPDLRAC